MACPLGTGAVPVAGVHQAALGSAAYCLVSFACALPSAKTSPSQPQETRHVG